MAHMQLVYVLALTNWGGQVVAEQWSVILPLSLRPANQDSGTEHDNHISPQDVPSIGCRSTDLTGHVCDISMEDIVYDFCAHCHPQEKS